ncbi:MAG: 5' nucleotidase, NT5C type [Candidatus Thorarchaeota archaeon]|jgi:5'(3')-deoxyribonucleotidase
MSKARVIVDVDSVCIELMDAVILWTQDTYGFTFTKDEVTEWEAVINEHKIWDLIVGTMNDPVYCRKVLPVCGAKEGISLLQEMGYDVVLATSRPERYESCTRECLNGFKYQTLVMESPKNNLGGDFLVDDNLDNILRFIETAGIGILYDRPWNQDRSDLMEDHEEGYVHYANNWGEVVGILSGLKKDD